MGLPVQQPVFTATDYLVWETEQLELASVALTLTPEQLFADVVEA